MTDTNKPKKRKPPKMTSGARGSVRKGKEGERFVAKTYRQWCADEGIHEPEISRNTLQSANGGSDIIGRDIGPWCVEVKCRASQSLPGWKKQITIAASEENKTYLALWVKAPYIPWQVHYSTDAGISWAQEGLAEHANRFRATIRKYQAPET